MAQGFDTKTPLWFYILKEAEVKQGGQRLGEVGSRLVVEDVPRPGRGQRPLDPEGDGLEADAARDDPARFT